MLQDGHVAKPPSPHDVIDDVESTAERAAAPACRTGSVACLDNASRRGLPTPMFEHILVPLDLTGRNARAVIVALDLVRQHGSRVTLLHVMQRIDYIPLGELRSFYRDLRVKAERVLKRAGKELIANRIRVRNVVQVGDVPRTIVRQAETNKVDLIVMGSHTVDPTQLGQGLGTTSYKVAILCRCPVMLVK